MRSGPRCVAYGLAALLSWTCLSTAFAEDTGNQALAEIVRRAVRHEVDSNQSSGMHFRFKDEKRTPQLSQTKLMVETSQATAGLLVMQNGHPLTPQQRHDEEARLANYIQSPQELRKKKKQEKEDAEHTERILRALPDAFLYQRDGTGAGIQSLGAPGDEFVRLNFRPDPSYNPPSHVEQVLTGMSGHLLIDTTQNRIAEIDGTLSKEVEFGWGILGHLDPGGRFLVQQSDVGDHQWEVTHMQLSFTGKVLFIKRINMHSNEIFSDFHSVPGNLTFAQGVELLKKEAGNLSASRSVEAGPKSVQSAQTRPRVEAKGQAVCCNP